MEWTEAAARRLQGPQTSGWSEMAHSERFERPTLGIEIRCSIQLSYECVARTIVTASVKASPFVPVGDGDATFSATGDRYSLIA